MIELDSFGGRVLLVGPSPPPFGGMAVQGRLLERKLLEDGVRVRVLATNPGLGVIERVPIVRTLLSTLIFVFKALLLTARTDVVHVLAASGTYFRLRVVPAVFVAKLFRRRVLINYRGGLAEEFFQKSWASVKRTIARADAVTVPSAFLSRIFEARGVKTTLVPNVTDLERFRFRDRATLKPRILVNRNFEAMYNVGLALDAFAEFQAQHPDATLTLAGSGPEEAALRAKAETLRLRELKFVGRVKNEDMAALYDAHDIYLNPTNADNMPISILEAMASGLPVVTTDAGGIPDLVAQNEDALLVPTNDARTTAAALHRLLTEPGLSAKLIQAGRAKADGFRWEKTRVPLLRIYRG